MVMEMVAVINVANNVPAAQKGASGRKERVEEPSNCQQFITTCLAIIARTGISLPTTNNQQQWQRSLSFGHVAGHDGFYDGSMTGEEGGAAFSPVMHIILVIDNNNANNNKDTRNNNKTINNKPKIHGMRKR